MIVNEEKDREFKPKSNSNRCLIVHATWAVIPQVAEDWIMSGLFH